MKKGFSLVEMLVSLIIISMLIGVGILVYRQQLIIIKKLKRNGIEKLLKYNQLRGVIASTFSYVITDYDRFGNIVDNYHIFFKGNRDYLTFITKSPLFYNGVSVVEMECKDNSLIYRESKLYSQFSNYLKPAISQDFYQKIFFTDLDECYFEYYFGYNKVSELYNKLPQAIHLKTDIDYFLPIKTDDNMSNDRIRVLNSED